MNYLTNSTWPLLSLCLLFCLANCQQAEPVKDAQSAYTLIDGSATEQTAALYQNLANLQGKHSLFGHQATLAYGYSWENEPNRSDVKDVTGSYPALYGWDIADFLPNLDAENAEMDEQRWNQNLAYAKEGLERGGVITYAWHMTNPVTYKSFYDTTRAIHAIIPGGEKHEEYKQTLDLVADFFKELSPMPVIFRPFHEHNGDWFWWGIGLTTEEDYITLWRFTLEYLRDKKQVNNLIWAFSPDRSRIDMDNFNEGYFYGYPGDEYVDIIGLDNYRDAGRADGNQTMAEKKRDFGLSMGYAAQIAIDKNKISALTETGLEAIPDSVWWTEHLLSSMLSSELSKRTTYVQVWRNATKARENRDHYYAPYPGQLSADDFIKFKETEFILFEDELPNMYSLPAKKD
jgi:mannan endo-1,4-beta-mannosidase